MAPRTFKLNRDELYIACPHPFKLPNGNYPGMIRVYELQKSDNNNNILANMNWSSNPEIIDPKTTTGYDSLEINDQPVDYYKLVQDLCRSRLWVNRRGYCYFQLRQGVTDTTETDGVTFYRMNDLWKWCDYGVNKDEENQALKNQVQILDSQICKKNAENQAFAEQLRKLQAELETAASGPKNKPVSSSVFTLKSIPFSWANYNPYTMYWTVAEGVPRMLTPTHEVVNTPFPIPLTFNLLPGQCFDVNNWFYMQVKERSAPILIYEGNACSLSIGGYAMTSPIDCSAILNWGSFVDREQEHFDFAPVALVGYGARIAILQWE
ncbi:hypothetical protein KSS87_020780 [Heliosperma pusillum]|nr:hypothetical protein KSS87_020780 [Heliosperma pusillum]